MLLVFPRCCQEDYADAADSTRLSGAMIIFRKHSNNFTFYQKRLDTIIVPDLWRYTTG